MASAPSASAPAAPVAPAHIDFVKDTVETPPLRTLSSFSCSWLSKHWLHAIILVATLIIVGAAVKYYVDDVIYNALMDYINSTTVKILNEHPTTPALGAGNLPQTPRQTLDVTNPTSDASDSDDDQ